MTANSMINIERLTLEERAELEEMIPKLCKIQNRIEQIRDRFEGKLHTRLDKVWLDLDDAIEAIELVGKRKLFSETTYLLANNNEGTK